MNARLVAVPVAVPVPRRGPVGPGDDDVELEFDGAAGPGGGAGRDGTDSLDDGLVDRVRAALVADGAEPTPARVAAALRSEARVLGQAEVLSVVTLLRSELAGAGRLEPLLRLPGVTDVLVNGAGAVWVDTGAGLTRTDVRFGSEREVRRLAVRLATTAGRRLDDANPYVDVRLADGTRFHAVLPPVSPDGTCLSLRVPARRAFTLDDIVAAGSLSPDGALWLRAVVEARLAFLVTGGTGSGKTTLLSCLLSGADPTERLVLVEDASELRPNHPHVVRLEARPPNVEGIGEVTLRALVRQAMRMRPDRLVVGEVRGAEVADLLAALNTGHEGGCGTVHANSAADVPARLEALGQAAGLRRDALHSQLAAGVDAVIHLERDRTGLRRVAEVCVLERGSDGLVVARRAVGLDGGRVEPGPGEPALRRRLALAHRRLRSVAPSDDVAGPVATRAAVHAARSDR